MGWQIVVGVLIVVAILLHFGEKAKERGQLAKRRAREQAQRGDLHRMSCTRDIREAWSADLRAMTLQVSRTEAGTALGAPEHYGLERAASGVWSIKDNVAAPELPARVAEQLEQRYQLLVGKLA